MVSETERDGTVHGDGLFRALFEHMAEGVALHDVIYDESDNPIEYRIIDINPAYTLHTGVTRSLVVGKTSFEAYGVTPPPYLEEFMVAGHLGRFNRFETYFLPMDRYFSISVAPMGKGHFATIFTDITEQKHHELLREQSERQFTQVFDLAPNPIAVTELDGTLINFNQAFCEVLESKREELVGKKTVELNIWPNPEQRQRLVEMVKRDGRINGLVVDIRTRSGQIRQLEFGGALIELGNRQIIVTAARDITEMLAAERARREASEELGRYFNLALDLMCIANVDGRFVRLNPSWEQVLG
jgi:PAS domain S-box-containing protein